MNFWEVRERRPLGFTLIEVLVTVVVIGVLAAIIIPAVASRAGAGDSTRVLEDLNNIRTGIENFAITVRAFPGDLDDLANPITTEDAVTDGAGGDGTVFTNSQVAAWAGPYIEAPVSSTTRNAGFDAIQTGYSASMQNQFDYCDVSQLSVCSGANANYVVIGITHLTVAQLYLLNELIDGVGEANSSTSGKFRMLPASNRGYYYVTPFK